MGCQGPHGLGGSHGSGGFLPRQGQASRCSTVRPARRRDSKYPARKGLKGPAFVRWLGALLRPRGLGQDRRGTQSPPALPCVLWYMFGRLGGVSVLLGSVESVRGRRAKGSLARRTGSVLASLSQGRRAHSTRGEGSRFSYPLNRRFRRGGKSATETGSLVSCTV